MNNVGRTASKNWLSLVLIFLFTFSVSLVGARFVRSILVGYHASETQEEAKPDANQNSESSATPDAVTLQPIIDAWTTSVGGQIGVIIYDLDRNEIAAKYNPNVLFPTDDVRGLLLAYDGYSQIDKGVESADTIIVDDLTYNDCLDTMVRSNNTQCVEALLENPVRAERIKSLLSELNMTQTTDFGQTSTAANLLLFLQHIWEHDSISSNSWAKLQDSMLNQPETDGTDWRQGLPSGFSTARVYSKASSSQNTRGDWENYIDLALVDFTKYDRHFAIVLLSNNPSDLNHFSYLGTLIEGKVIEK